MAILQDLIMQVSDPELRDRILQEANKLSKQKKFGLVFEEHLPECTPLYDIPVKRGSSVALKTGKVSDIYIVQKITSGIASCIKKDNQEQKEFPVDDLVCVAEFGEPIYPYLKPIDSVCNAPDSDLWHTLIEADNYHALQLLEYLYAGKVDCIYIDPPYNTGARDWKYNNDYVDSSDQYRHSKWLSFMEKRLKIAKKLLNPNDSVLIVTIDEKEYLHLGMLLEEMFPEARMQMISTMIKPGGVARDKQFFRTDEYLFIIELGDSAPVPLSLSDEWTARADKRTTQLSWRQLSRSGSNSLRSHSPGCFYPIFVSKDGSKIVKVGEPLQKNANRNSIIAPEGTVAIWPIHMDGAEGCWMQTPENLKRLINLGYVRLGKFSNTGMAISYLNRKEIEKLNSGGMQILGRRSDNSIIVDDSNYQRESIPGTQWSIYNHNALIGGTNLLASFFAGKRFDFPKSLYATHDAIRFFVANKPDAIVVDFFAGSGTTLHAVNLLNAEDGGHRRCIIVTNNEVSDAEAKALTKQGYKPGDVEWEKLGIARYVTWPRTVCSIEGHDINGNPLKGNYIGSDIPMSDGFKANAAYFKLGFLDKTAVALGRQFKELLPVLWMKSGCVGQCPSLDTDELPDMLILPDNKFAVLLNESYYSVFVKELDKHPEIQTIFIITDSESAYRNMIANFEDKDTYQLYRDYLDNFRINTGR